MRVLPTSQLLLPILQLSRLIVGVRKLWNKAGVTEDMRSNHCVCFGTELVQFSVSLKHGYSDDDRSSPSCWWSGNPPYPTAFVVIVASCRGCVSSSNSITVMISETRIAQ